MTTGIKRTQRPLPIAAPMTWASEPGSSPSLSLAWVSRPCDGESVNGDAVSVRPQETGAVLVTVIDALGHGPRAAEVAQTACAWLEKESAIGTALAATHGLHRELHGSRGAAALSLLVGAKGIEACSVGNVELRSTANKLPFVLTPGVLGVRLQKARVSFATAPLSDRFVLHSDGISGRFDIKALRDKSPADAAAHIFANHRHSHDDATVLVLDLQLA